MKKKHPATFQKACYAKWLVRMWGWTLTHAAIFLELNVGTISHIIHGRRFPTSYPVEPPRP